MQVKQQPYMKVLVVGLFTVAMAAGLVAHNAAAQSASESANALKISPVRTDVSMNPGEKKKVKITVTNPANFDVTVRPVQNDFIAGDENGTPALILDENEFAPNHSLKRFMEPVENVTVPSRESKTVELGIAVPSGAEPGGYFGALRFAPVASADGGQVNLNTSVASIILLRVNGDVPEKLDMTDFEVRKDGKEGNFFMDGNNLSVFFRFKNEGGVQLGPIGKISVVKGNEVVYETDFNNKDQRDTVLPDSARRWNVGLEGIEGFGKYTVNTTFTYGSKNQTIEVVKSFWIVPVWVMIAAGIGLLLFIGLIIALVYYFRKRSRRMSFGGR